MTPKRDEQIIIQEKRVPKKEGTETLNLGWGFSELNVLLPEGMIYYKADWGVQQGGNI